MLAAEQITKALVEHTGKVTVFIPHYATSGGTLIVPVSASALRSAKLVRNATLKIYAGAPHGLADTHKDQLNADLLAFIKT